MRIAAVTITLTMALEPPQNAQRFLIARHGETNFNAEGRIQGTLDTSVLTARGVRQAEELGCYIAEEELVRIAKVWVSPMTRARQTLACIEEACGTLLPEAVVRDDLREIELHTWEGKLKSEVMDTGWARWKADPAAFVMDDGARPLPDLWARAVGNWAALRRDAPGCSLVVSHGALGRCMVAAAHLQKPEVPVRQLRARRGGLGAGRAGGGLLAAAPPGSNGLGGRGGRAGRAGGGLGGRG